MNADISFPNNVKVAVIVINILELSKMRVVTRAPD